MCIVRLVGLDIVLYYRILRGEFVGVVLDFSHLRKVNQGYFFHLLFALKWGGYLIFTGLVSIVHGLFPFLFPFLAPRNILKVSRMIEKSSDYEQIIKDTKGS